MFLTKGGGKQIFRHVYSDKVLVLGMGKKANRDLGFFSLFTIGTYKALLIHSCGIRWISLTEFNFSGISLVVMGKQTLLQFVIYKLLIELQVYQDQTKSLHHYVLLKQYQLCMLCFPPVHPLDTMAETLLLSIKVTLH